MNVLRDALELLHQGDPAGALDRFHPMLAHVPGRALEPAAVDEGFGVLAKILAALGHRDLATACATASLTPTALAYYEVGYALVEARLHRLAATALFRARALLPGSARIAGELVAALERDLLYAEARRVLAEDPALLADSFLCRYLLAFDCAMCGDLATVRGLAPTLVPEDDTQGFMAKRIAALLARVDRIAAATPLDGDDLAGWHHAITGGVLLHRCAHGWDAMHGRYGLTDDDGARVRTGLDRLRAVLVAWGVTPPCIYAAPDRDSEILAAIASRRLGLAIAPWPAVGVPAPGLVIAYALDAVPWKELQRLQDRRAGQILYAHTAQWTEDGAVAPDVVTFLAQYVRVPWPPDGEPDAIAATLAGGPGLAADDAARDDPAALARLVAAAGPPAPGRRERMWAGSPVLSNRFVDPPSRVLPSRAP